MISRHQNITIPQNIIESFFNEVGNPINKESDNISEIWKNVFKKYDELNNRDINDSKLSDICDLFENYFINGLSDGACAGKAMEKILTRYKYLSREKKRLASLYLQRNPGVENSYSRIGAGLKLNKKNYKEIVSDMNNLKLSKLVFSGCPWMYSYKNKKYLLELTDHYYFFDIISRYLANKTVKPIFIGEGSGILSNLILNSDLIIKDSVFIDLQHFLLRQYIINFSQHTKVNRYIYAQDFNSSLVESSGMTIINQDSFPEIPENALNSYFSLIDEGRVERVISYNHLDLRGDHANYRNMLVKNFGEPHIRFESVLRNGYFVEIFEFDKT